MDELCLGFDSQLFSSLPGAAACGSAPVSLASSSEIEAGCVHSGLHFQIQFFSCFCLFDLMY